MHPAFNIENLDTWYFPKLRILSLLVGRETWRSCVRLLKQHATLLETLILSNIHFNALSQIKIALPKLKILSIDSRAPPYCPVRLLQVDNLECSSVREVCNAAGLSKDASYASSQNDIDEAERKFVKPILQYWELHKGVKAFEMCGNWNVLNTVVQMGSTRDFVAELSERGATLEIISADNPYTRRTYKSLADFA